MFIIADNDKAYFVVGNSIDWNNLPIYKKVAYFYFKRYKKYEGISSKENEPQIISESDVLLNCKSILEKYNVTLVPTIILIDKKLYYKMELYLCFLLIQNIIIKMKYLI